MSGKKVHNTIYLIYDKKKDSYLGKPGNFGRTGQPAVYWTRGRASGALNSLPVPNKENRDDCYQIVPINLSNDVEF